MWFMNRSAPDPDRAVVTTLRLVCRCGHVRFWDRREARTHRGGLALAGPGPGKCVCGAAYWVVDRTA